MDSPYRILFAALLGIGAVGFFSVLWVVPAYYTFIPRRLASITRVLYCAIGCGYIVVAYFALQGMPSLIAFSYVLIFLFLFEPDRFRRGTAVVETRPTKHDTTRVNAAPWRRALHKRAPVG